MTENTEILTFSSSDIRLQILKRQLETSNIDFIERETTAYMEPGIELKVKKNDLEKIEKIINDLSLKNTLNSNSDQPGKQRSTLTKIRRFSSLATWIAIFSTTSLLVFLSREIIRDKIPSMAWTAVIFMTAFIAYVGYKEIRRN